MKIFSNFDTQRKQEAVSEAIEKFGESNILVLRKSKLFLFSKVVWPILWWTLVFVAIQFPIYLVLDEFGSVRYFLTAGMFIAYLIMISPNFKYYIDYAMDFSIITPFSLTRYNQTGILHRDIKSSNIRNIKTVSIDKNNFWYNIFDNGDLIFLSEGDQADQGEITLHYIQDPESQRKEITRIMRINHLNQ